MEGYGSKRAVLPMMMMWMILQPMSANSSSAVTWTGFLYWHFLQH
jgi:hypothetical protein